jgi:hypothetical protein
LGHEDSVVVIKIRAAVSFLFAAAVLNRGFNPGFFTVLGEDRRAEDESL